MDADYHWCDVVIVVCLLGIGHEEDMNELCWRNYDSNVMDTPTTEWIWDASTNLPPFLTNSSIQKQIDHEPHTHSNLLYHIQSMWRSVDLMIASPPIEHQDEPINNGTRFFIDDNPYFFQWNWRVEKNPGGIIVSWTSSSCHRRPTYCKPSVEGNGMIFDGLCWRKGHHLFFLDSHSSTNKETWMNIHPINHSRIEDKGEDGVNLESCLASISYDCDWRCDRTRNWGGKQMSRVWRTCITFSLLQYLNIPPNLGNPQSGAILSRHFDSWSRVFTGSIHLQSVHATHSSTNSTDKKTTIPDLFNQYCPNSTQILNTSLHH